MNARERIARVLAGPEGTPVLYLPKADAVLAVLPELLTDEQVMQAAVEMYDKSIRLASSAAVRRILNAAAKTLTEQEATS